MNRRAWFAVTLLLLLGVLWGSGYALARYAMTHGVAPLGYAFWQTLGPAVLLALIGCRQWRSARLSLALLGFFVITGLFGIAIPNSTMYFASAHLPSGLLAVLVNTAPLLTYGFAWCCADESYQPWRVLAVLLCVFGLMLLAWTAHSSTLMHDDALIWLAIAFISPVCFAAVAVFTSRRRPVQVTSMTLAVGMLTTAFICLLPVVIKTHAFYALTSPWRRVDQVIALEMLLSSLGYVVFFHLIRLSGSVYYSLVAGVVALTGLFWGWLLFQEQFSVLQWLAILLILISIVLMTQRFQRQPTQ